jgi:hypothetical protein
MPSRLLGLLVVFAVCGDARGAILERVLAVVDGRPVMLSEVSLLERLRGVPRQAALDAVIDERLMFQEAARLPQAVVSAEDEQQAYESLASRAPAEAGLLPEELRTLARRETAILRYVAFRFRSQVRIGDEAARAAYDAEFGGRADAPAFADAAPAIRERLASKQLDERIEAWVRELRAGAEIRYNN